MRPLLSLVALLSLLCTQAQTRTIKYQWLNQSCATNLNCNNGCSACDVPANQDPGFFGTNMIWTGVSICPHPTFTGSGDNAVYSEGWTAFPESDHYAMASGLSVTSMHIDSLIIRHRRSQDGPAKLKVQFGTDGAAPMREVANADVPHTEYAEVRLADLGCIVIAEGMPYGTFQLLLQPYQGEVGGEYHLDEVRIVATPCEQLTTGIIEEFKPTDKRTGTYFDVLGRPVQGNDAAPGVYSGPKRVVRVL